MSGWLTLFRKSSESSLTTAKSRRELERERERGLGKPLADVFNLLLASPLLNEYLIMSYIHSRRTNINHHGLREENQNGAASDPK